MIFFNILLKMVKDKIQRRWLRYLLVGLIAALSIMHFIGSQRFGSGR